jgi:hypothetical protein
MVVSLTDMGAYFGKEFFPPAGPTYFLVWCEAGPQSRWAGTYWASWRKTWLGKPKIFATVSGARSWVTRAKIINNRSSRYSGGPGSGYRILEMQLTEQAEHPHIRPPKPRKKKK